MNKKLNNRKGFIHLYNPKKEGLGTYDINYINAYKKNKVILERQKYKTSQRYAA